MWVINKFFFPDDSTKLLVSICYLILLVTAFKRFNILAVDYGSYDAPENARPWTTWLRFYAAGTVYFCLYGLLFATLYRFMSQYPALIGLAQDVFKSDSLAESVLSRIKHDPKLLYPILAVLLLTAGVSRLRTISGLERNARNFFQRIGSIPRQVAHTTRLMRSSKIRIDLEECAKELTAKMKEEVLLPVKQKDEKSFERMYMKARHLYSNISAWDRKGSPFFHYKTVYQKQFENISNIYLQTNKEIERYYIALFNIRSTVESLEQATGETDAPSLNSEEFFKPLRENRMELRGALKGLLENMYTFMACAVHKEALSEKARLELIKQFGFEIPGNELDEISFADPNDIALLSMLLVIVVPAVALFSNSFHLAAIQTHSVAVFILWPAMALSVGVAGVVSISKVKKKIETSNTLFWNYLKPKTGNKPWTAYIVAGLAALACSIVALVGLSYLDPAQADVPLAKSLWILGPWSLVSFAVAVMTGFNLDRTPSPQKIDRLIDILLTAAATILAALAAILVSVRTLDLAILGEDIYIFFVIPAAALLGGSVGAVVPRNYRKYRAKQVKLDLTEIDLSTMIKDCRDALSERIDEGRVKLRLDIEPNLQGIAADSNRLKQALFGLLTNALEHTAPDDEIVVTVHSLNDEQVEIMVRDSGIGIKQKQLYLVKDSLTFAESAPLDGIDVHSPATLQQIKSIINRHGGTLDLASKQWEGTTARVKLPKKIDIPGTPGQAA
jgi:hypothetical protein